MGGMLSRLVLGSNSTGFLIEYVSLATLHQGRRIARQGTSQIHRWSPTVRFNNFFSVLKDTVPNQGRSPTSADTTTRHKCSERGPSCCAQGACRSTLTAPRTRSKTCTEASPFESKSNPCGRRILNYSAQARSRYEWSQAKTE